MINTAFRVWLTFNATSLLVIIFLVQKEYTLDCFFGGVTWLEWTAILPNAVSYLLIPIALGVPVVFCSYFFDKNEFRFSRDREIGIPYYWDQNRVHL